MRRAGGRRPRGGRHQEPSPSRPHSPPADRLQYRRLQRALTRGDQGRATQARVGSGSAATRPLLLLPRLPPAQSGCIERLLASSRRAGEADAAAAAAAAAAAFSPQSVLGRPRYSRRSASTRLGLEPGPPLEPGRRRLVLWLSCVSCSCSCSWVCGEGVGWGEGEGWGEGWGEGG
jgi:hypothetical protein